jgi:hypothetical protein
MAVAWLVARFGIGPDSAGHCWWLPVTIPIGCVPVRRSRCCAGLRDPGLLGEDASVSAESERDRQANVARYRIVVADPIVQLGAIWLAGSG